MTLYETLNEMGGEDISKYTPEQKKEIEDYMADRVGKKIGLPEYKKLEDFVEQNKGDERLNDIVGSIVLPLAFQFMMSGESITTEKRMGYSVAVKLHEVLSKRGYDLEQAVLDRF